MTSAAAGFGEPPPPPPHVAQRSRRDKLRFPATADMMLSAYDDAPTTGDAYAGRACATDLGYLHAVVAPPLAAPADPWRAAQCDASAPWAAPAACAKPEHGGSGSGRLASQAALSLTLSPALQELPASYGGSLQSVVGAAVAAGPLGPFTGYAAVLKGSRFLRPAQQLLDEFCAAVVGVESSTADISAGASPSSLNSSSSEAGGGGDMQCQRPEFREKKAKLLYMQDEVCKRYKQYHQQVQMVVSLFESVPGLSSATPYASSALKSISKHFRHLRSLISTQIQQISRLLGEEFLSLPSSSGGSGKASTPRLGFVEQGQPVWRPQRGLPERAVAVLRAWLFDHFLHPYPTDADKHMLATQTGLSRNQVSNWFINARVRLWKPMVEEIHMLETRATANPNAPSNSVGSRHLNPAASSTARPPLPPQQLPPPECGHPMMEQCCVSALQDDGCAPMDHQPVPHCGGMQGGGHVMMSFGAGPPYAGGMHVGGGFGAVSLTLGLRRDVSYPQQQFGGQMLRDLVG